MADKNNNGIPDDRERPGTRGGAGGSFGEDAVLSPGLGYGPWNKRTPGKTTYAPSTRYGGILGELANFSNDATRNIYNFVGSNVLGQNSPKGGGMGDSLVGRNPADLMKAGGMSRQRGSAPIPKNPQAVDQSSMSFLDALQMASQMIPGVGGIGRVNYDPERQTARSNAAEADARLGAMYRQLQDSIAADQPGIQAAYQQAIDNTNAGSQAAQQSVQAATDAAQQRNQGVLAALGIGDANQQIIAQGRDVNSATANTMADMAAAQQADTNALTQNQATAVQQNRSIGSAAGLEGNLQRAQNQAKLQALLSQIDMAEQDKNTSIDAQNAQAGNGAFSQAMSLAGQLYGSSQDQQSRQDQLQMQAMKMAGSQGTQRDLGSYLKALGINPADVAADPAKYGSLLSALSKYNVTQ